MIGWYAMQLKARLDRARHRRAMLRAIEVAAERHEIWGFASKADGLRAIRAVERLNGRQFDPHATCLIEAVRGRGARERHRRLERVATQ